VRSLSTLSWAPLLPLLSTLSVLPHAIADPWSNNHQRMCTRYFTPASAENFGVHMSLQSSRRTGSPNPLLLTRSSTRAIVTHAPQRRGEKHEDRAWGAYRVLYSTSQPMCPALKESRRTRQGKSKVSKRERTHNKYAIGHRGMQEGEGRRE